MTIRQEIIALAVRILVNNTSLIAKPTLSDDYIRIIFGLESYDQRMARNIDVALDEVTVSVKRANLNRKFNKIVRNV